MSTDWPERLFVVDVEGNGASPPDLVEVACIPIVNGCPEPEKVREWLIRPPVEIPSRISRIHGITNAMVAEAPSWERVAGEVLEVLDGAWMVAHSASVEYKVLTRHMPEWKPAGVIDTLRLARVADRKQRGYGLDALIESLGLDVAGIPGKRHRAAYDAHATALLLLNLAAKFSTWRDLAAVAVPPNMPGLHEAAVPDEENSLW